MKSCIICCLQFSANHFASLSCQFIENAKTLDKWNIWRTWKYGTYTANKEMPVSTKLEILYVVQIYQLQF